MCVLVCNNITLYIYRPNKCCLAQNLFINRVCISVLIPQHLYSYLFYICIMATTPPTQNTQGATTDPLKNLLGRIHTHLVSPIPQAETDTDQNAVISKLIGAQYLLAEYLSDKAPRYASKYSGGIFLAFLAPEKRKTAPLVLRRLTEHLANQTLMMRERVHQAEGLLEDYFESPQIEIEDDLEDDLEDDDIEAGNPYGSV